LYQAAKKHDILRRLHQAAKMHDILIPIKENGLNLDLVTYSIRNMCGGLWIEGENVLLEM
jgi:hypothetical protein